MTDHLTPRRFRRPLRTSIAIAVLAATAAMTAPASPASAAPPETWLDNDNPSLGRSLLEIGVPVLVIIAVIALLTYLPSMVRSSRGDHALTFSEKSDWFGGPRTGVSDKAEEPQGTGGASARW